MQKAKVFNQDHYLSGIVTVKRDAPLDWKEMAVLPFWERPNDERWGRRLSRVLYHEALHFWQFVNSPYLIGVVSRYWGKLLHYEATGELLLEDSLWNDQKACSSERFSNYELVECWARFWEVHTRNPIEIIRDESIEANGFLSYRGHYTDHAYDTVMTNGHNCQLYAGPYRWLLEVCDGNSLLAHVIFPLIANAAFSTLHPSRFFYEAIERALKSSHLRQAVLEYRAQSINLTWLQCWDVVMTEAVIPFSKQAGETLVPFRKAGYQAIEDGLLSSHPVFEQYVKKAHGSNFRLYFQYWRDTSEDTEYSEWINSPPKKCRSIVCMVCRVSLFIDAL